MKRKRKYGVWFRVLCEQGIEVEATSKKEALEKAKKRDGEPIDFVVLCNYWSTSQIVADHLFPPGSEE